MIIEFLLATVLDMSLPEFQPQEDLSGNYIVMDYDVSENDFVVKEISSDDISKVEIQDPLQGLSLEDLGESKVINRSIDYSSMTLLPTSTIKLSLNSDTHKIENVGSSARNTYIYVVLQPNVTYYIDTDAPRLIITDNFQTGNSYTSYEDIELPYTPSELTYGFVLNTRYLNVYYSDGSGDNPGGDVSGDTPGGDTPGGDSSDNNPGGSVNVDLTNIENNLDNVIILQRSILMVLLVNFLFPVIKSCANLLKGGKDV